MEREGILKRGKKTGLTFATHNFITLYLFAPCLPTGRGRQVKKNSINKSKAFFLWYSGKTPFLFYYCKPIFLSPYKKRQR